MNDRRTDFELLRTFFKQGDQGAFADLARRHIDLVYATALRKANDEGGAEEISQNVFTALARKAWRFAPDDSLPAWLYRTTLLEAKEWVRGELRRRRREQTAAELGTTMRTPDEQTALRALVPLLDEAMLSLREKDRTALLLRFYERRSLRELGEALGVGEDAAQKRVAGAVERVAQFFQRRGFKTATLAATTAMLENTSTSVSATTATLVANVALKNAPAISALMAFLARFTGLTKLQTAAACAVLAVGPVAWQWNEFHRERSTAIQFAGETAARQTEFTSLQTEIADLRETLARLDKAHLAAMDAAARRAESQQKFEEWKKHLREQMLAGDFRWTDDCPFVRIPKSVVGEFEVSSPLSSSGKVVEPARELFGLTPEERQQIEGAVQKHLATMDWLAQSRVYETNQARYVHMATEPLASKILVQTALGDAAEASKDELQTTLTNVLGQARWGFIQRPWEGNGIGTLSTMLQLDSDSKDQETAAWISEKDGKILATVGWGMDWGSCYSSGVSLDVFLPGATNTTVTLPDGTKYEFSIEDNLGWRNLLPSLKQPLLDWFQQQALTRLKGTP